MGIEYIIIKTFLKIEKSYKKITKNKKIRTRGPAPKLSDIELITMHIAGAFRGLNSDKKVWTYFSEHFKNWFPNLKSYKNFCKHSSKLTFIIQLINKDLMQLKKQIHIVDGFPISVCKYVRAYRCKRFKEKVSFGYCAAKDEKYYGFKGHLLVDENRRISSFVLTAANVDERAILDNFIGKFQGLFIGDKGYLSSQKQVFLKEFGIDLQTPLRKNMKDNRNKKVVNWMRKIRKRVETTIGVLVEKYNFTRIKVRKINQLMRKFATKILAYNLELDWKKT